MIHLLFGIAILAAITDWLAVARHNQRLEYFAKPAVMLALLAWLGLQGGFSGQMLWFALGLFLALVGDIFLMLPKERLMPGLAAFLGAHLAYLMGFNASLPPASLPTMIIAVGVGLSSARLTRRFIEGLAASHPLRLKIPVLAYSLVISLMLVSALLTLVRPEWGTLAALLVSSGAVLFYLSDSMLAYHKFVRQLPNSHLTVMVTYHIAQLLIILGAARQYLF